MSVKELFPSPALGIAVQGRLGPGGGGFKTVAKKKGMVGSSRRPEHRQMG